MINVVHIDEKWFHITEISKTFFVSLNESESYRKCKSKRFITKIIFMTTVGSQGGMAKFEFVHSLTKKGCEEL